MYKLVMQPSFRVVKPNTWEIPDTWNTFGVDGCRYLYTYVKYTTPEEVGCRYPYMIRQMYGSQAWDALTAWSAFWVLFTWSQPAKDHGLFYLNYPQINEVKKSKNMAGCILIPINVVHILHFLLGSMGKSLLEIQRYLQTNLDFMQILNNILLMGLSGGIFNNNKCCTYY